MTSSIEDQLSVQFHKFAKSDEALKEVIARLSELESLSTAHRQSKDSLDSTKRSIDQLVTDFGSLLPVSISSVGGIAQVARDMGSAIQTLEDEIIKSITNNIEGITDKIQKSVTQIEDVASSQKETVNKLLAAIDGVALRAEANTFIIMERLEELEASTTQSTQKAAIKTWVATGVATLIIVALTIAI